MTGFEMNGTEFVIIPKAEYMMLRLASLKGKEDTDEEIWTRKDICTFLGISKSCLSESPWLLPYNGAGMLGKRKARWFKSEVILWHSKSRNELKEQYRACSGSKDVKRVS